jgi:pyrroline-5-carboxylate reductase
MKITFIGGGNMAGAIIGGLLRDGFDGKAISVIEPLDAARAQLSKHAGVSTVTSLAELAAIGDVIVLAVKPQQMRAALEPLAARLQDQVILSIAAGLRVTDLARWLGGYTRIVRCMPNTPALIGAGITAACAPAGLAADKRAGIERILKAIGKVVWVDDEAQLDAVTAVSGSGPAYVFYFMEAMRDAATGLGLTPATAAELTLETVLGAARLAAAGSDDVAVLRERVTSKGGTTEAALKSMHADKVKESIMRAVNAANDRSRVLGIELGAEPGKN